MRFESQTFWVAKDAEYANEYQDAFEIDAERGIVAIADGVASAIFCGPWARLLTRATVASPPNLSDGAEFQAWLSRYRATWLDEIDLSRITWNQRPKMVDGAMTTLLWIELAPSAAEDGSPAGYRLRCFAIGDCCLFHLRGQDMLRSFPMETAAEFGLDPAVIGSIDRKQDHLIEFQAIEDDCRPGDLLVLCTDALAQWALSQWEAGEPVQWDRYWDLPEEDWLEEVFALRRATRMRYDDTTLVLLRVVEETAAPATPPDGATETADAVASAAIEGDALIEPEVVAESAAEQEEPLPAAEEKCEGAADVETEPPLPTDASTEPPIQASTEPLIQASTEPPAEARTDPPTEAEPEPGPLTDPATRGEVNE